MEENTKKNTEQVTDEEKLDLEDLEKVSGGKNPWGDYIRVPGQKYPVDDSEGK